MDMQPSGPPPSREPRFSSEALLAALILIAAVVFLWHAWDEEVGDSVEERIALTSREMWRQGEWILPTMNGELRLQKPPLAYWVCEVTAGAMGEFDEAVLRFPFALIAVLTLLGTYVIGVTVWGREVGLIAAIVLLSSTLFLKVGKMATTDGVLLGCVTGFWLFHLRARATASLHGTTVAARHRWASYACLGAGVLAKGPVVLVATVLPVLIEAGVTRSKEPLRALRSLLGPITLVVVGITWPLLVLWRLGDAPAVAEQWMLESFGKMLPGEVSGVTDEYLRHVEPWSYYLTRLPSTFGIWIIPLVLAIPRGWSLRRARAARAPVSEAAALPGRRGDAPLRPAVVSWFAVVFLFFSLISEKKTFYLLPLVPAGALLAADVIEAGYRSIRAPLRRLVGWLLLPVLFGAALLVLAVAAPGIVDDVAAPILGTDLAIRLSEAIDGHGPSLIALAAIIAGGPIALRISLGATSPVLPALSLGAMIALFGVPAATIRLDTLPAHKLIRAAAREAGARAPEIVYGCREDADHLPSGLLYYFDRRVTFLDATGEADLQNLPIGSGLLLTKEQLRLIAGAAARPDGAGDPDTSGLPPLTGPLRGYNLVVLIHGDAKDPRDCVALLRKEA